MDRRGLLKATGTAFGVLGGAQVIGAQSAQAAATGPIVNVRDCGALGNGTTDDTTAFQQAFAAGAGGTVLIPPGVYPISSTMTLAAGTTVSAYGARIVRNNANCSALLRNIDGTTSTPGYSGAGRLAILGGTWDMAGATYTKQADAIGIAHAQDVLIQDCTILNVPSAHAIELNAVRGARVVDCTFDGLNTAVDQDKEAIQITGATSAANLPAPPYDNTPCSDVLISGCTLRATPATGYSAFGALCGDHNSVLGVTHSNIRVIGNYVEGVSDRAIKVADWQHSVVANNTIEKAAVCGIDVRSPNSSAQNALTGILIQNNSINATGGPNNSNGGITVSGNATAPISGVVVSGNVVTATQGEYGVFLGFAPQAVVTGNSVSDTRRKAATGNCQAIELDSCPGSVLADNVAANIAGDGMFVNVGSDGTVVSGNRITGCATHGLWVAAHDLAVRNNVISGANTDGAATAYGIRTGSSAKNMSIQGNSIRKTTGVPDPTAAIGVTAGTTGAWIIGNDLRGWGAAAISDAGTGTVTTTGNLS